MGSEDGLVEIHPRELRFTFEVKKQSSCSVYLVNKSDEYVAFKVKTTSPKRYSVRPNIGVILPRETCFFTVAMQALKTAPPDLQIKDKFLVQTTVVPFGTADGGTVSTFFSKETGGYIEENKLRVVLVSATQAEEEQLIGGIPNANTAVKVPVAKEKLNVMTEVPNGVNEIPSSLKTSFHPLRENSAPFSVNESHIPAPSKEAPITSAESVIESHMPAPSKEAPVTSAESVNECHIPAPSKEAPATSAESVNEHIPAPSKEAPVTSAESAHHFKGTPSFSAESQFSSAEANVALNKYPESLKDTSARKKVTILSGLTNAENINYVTEDVQNLKSKLNNLEVKLEEAESLIIKLREETRVTIHERNRLQHEMVFAKRKGTSRGQAGFPLLFVVYVAFLGMSLGYMSHL